MNKFSILPTKDRKGAKDDYIVCVNPSIKKRMRLGRFAVVIHHHLNIDKKLKAPCRVIIDETLSDTEVRVDQTLRNAVGIPFEYDRSKTTVQIYPLRLSWFQLLQDSISHKLGRRYLFFRVCKADIPDLEKSLCRIPLDAFRLLGCDEGDKVVCESPIFLEESFYRLKVHKIQAYKIPEEVLKKRETMEMPNISTRYPSAEKLLKVTPDIWRVFFDAHVREILQVDSIDPIRIRRDFFDLFLKQIREFGIIFLLSILAVAYTFPIKITWQLLILILVISVTFAFLLILMNIRAKIK